MPCPTYTPNVNGSVLNVFTAYFLMLNPLTDKPEISRDPFLKQLLRIGYFLTRYVIKTALGG